MPRTAWQVTLHVSVNDPQALHAAAFAQATGSDSLTRREAFEILGTKRRPDVSACLRWLFDPGTSPDGCEIVDSGTDGGDSLD